MPGGKSVGVRISGQRSSSKRGRGVTKASRGWRSRAESLTGGKGWLSVPARSILRLKCEHWDRSLSIMHLVLQGARFTQMQATMLQ